MVASARVYNVRHYRVHIENHSASLFACVGCLLKDAPFALNMCLHMSCCVRPLCDLMGCCCVVSSGDQRVAGCKQHEASRGAYRNLWI